MVTTPISTVWNVTSQVNELLNQMQGILQFVVNSNVAGEPLTSVQLSNLKTRFFTLRDQVVTLLNTLSPA
jgi:hypothetical protein